MKVAGVVLAAGGSSRFGTANKLLHPLLGRPLVAYAVAALENAPCDARAVVLGHDVASVRCVLPEFSGSYLTNDRWTEGMATSLQCAVKWAMDDINASHLLVMLGDMPEVAATHIIALLKQANANPASIVRAVHKGMPGNPVLLPHQAFTGLLQTGGDHGARWLIEHGFPTVDVELDSAVCADIDTRDALQRFS